MHKDFVLDTKTLNPVLNGPELLLRISPHILVLNILFNYFSKIRVTLLELELKKILFLCHIQRHRMIAVRCSQLSTSGVRILE